MAVCGASSACVIGSIRSHPLPAATSTSTLSKPIAGPVPVHVEEHRDSTAEGAGAGRLLVLRGAGEGMTKSSTSTATVPAAKSGFVVGLSIPRLRRHLEAGSCRVRSGAGVSVTSRSSRNTWLPGAEEVPRGPGGWSQAIAVGGVMGAAPAACCLWRCRSATADWYCSSAKKPRRHPQDTLSGTENQTHCLVATGSYEPHSRPTTF